MSLNELTPVEILTIYLMNQGKLDRYDEIFKTRVITEELVVSDTTVMSSHYTLDDQAIEQLQNSMHYNFVLGLQKKLHPIASVIMDVEKDLYNQILDSFKETI